MYRAIVGSPLWDCRTYWFTERAESGDRRSQARSQNSPDRNTSDTHGTLGLEEAELGQAAAPVRTCKGQD